MSAPPEKLHRNESAEKRSEWHSVAYTIPRDETSLLESPEATGPETREIAMLRYFGGVAGGGLASLPLLLVVVSDGRMIWLRKAPRGVVVVKVDFQGLPSDTRVVSEAAASVLCAVTVRGTSGLASVVSAVSLSVGKPFSLPFVPSACIVQRESSVAVIADRSSTALHGYRIHETLDMTPLFSTKVTPSPVDALVCMGSWLGVVDSKGVIEFFTYTEDAGVVQYRGNNTTKASREVQPQWESKAKTDLFHLLKAKCVAVLDVATNVTGSRFAVVFTSPTGRRCAVWNTVTGKLICDLALDDDKTSESNDASSAQLMSARDNDLAMTRCGHVSFASASTVLVAVARGIARFNPDSASSAKLPQSHFEDAALAFGISTFPIEVSEVSESCQELREIASNVDAAVFPEFSAQSVPNHSESAVFAVCRRGAQLLLSMEVNSDGPQPDPSPKPFPLGFHVASSPTAVIQDKLISAKQATIVTSCGRIGVELFPGECPKAVHNFKTLADRGFYRGLTFHRVVPGFMIQGGCPRGDGTAGESAFGEPFEDESTARTMDQFSLCMANRGPATNESQFFITTVATPWLQGKHTLFGKVTTGHEVVQQIEKVPTGKHDKPLKPVFIVDVMADTEGEC